jgi:hypothetical protein
MPKRPPWQPSERALRSFARVHLSYEVTVLHAQLEALTFADGPRLHDVTDLACFEAALVHLRLLDDFFRAQPSGDDVVATHFLPSWKPRGFLTEPQRDRINAQVAHLTGRRGRPQHNLGRMARTCGARFLQLETRMRKGPPEAQARLRCLQPTFEAAYWLGRLGDQVAGAPRAPDLLLGS